VQVIVLEMRSLERQSGQERLEFIKKSGCFQVGASVQGRTLEA
jgi:hypothetical protein